MTNRDSVPTYDKLIYATVKALIALGGSGSYFATHLSENSVNPKIIQKLLGHRNLATTMIYCEVSPKSMRNAVELLS